MKKNRKYIVILAITVTIFVLFNIFSPRKIDWTATFSADDKNPFGSFLLDAFLADLFPERVIHNNNLTIYELDSLRSEKDNLIVMASSIPLGEEDVDALLNAVYKGTHVLLSANFFKGSLADTLGLYTESVLFSETFNLIDTVYIEFTNPSIKRKRFRYRLEDMHTFFKIDSLKMPAYVVARNSYRKPVTLRIPFGKGQLILNTTPHAFTNHYLLADNHELIERTLSYLPANSDVWWTEYYQLGRLESTSVLRAIMKSEALSWAYYILIATLLIFMVVEGRRKQRIIPVIKPLPNTTLEFVKTIGNMYIQAADHKSIAEKKIIYFLDHARSTYFLPDEHHESFVEKLAKKSGNSMEETSALLSLIKIIRGSSSISPEMLLELNRRIEAFNHTK